MEKKDCCENGRFKKKYVRLNTNVKRIKKENSKKYLKSVLRKSILR